MTRHRLPSSEGKGQVPEPGSSAAVARPSGLIFQRRRGRRGQALVEFAFLVTVLTLLLLGTFELGRLFTAWIAVGNMARTAAQYGTMAGSLADDDPATMKNMMETVAYQELDANYVPGGSKPKLMSAEPNVTASLGKDPADHWCAEVTVSYPVKKMFPIIPTPNQVERTVKMRLQFVPNSFSEAVPDPHACQKD